MASRVPGSTSLRNTRSTTNRARPSTRKNPSINRSAIRMAIQPAAWNE